MNDFRRPFQRPSQAVQGDDTPRPVPESNLRWRDLPVSRYAVWHRTEERWRFFEVTRPDKGKWLGWTFIRELSGENRIKIDPKDIPLILGYIEAHTAKAMTDYGKQSNTCSRCHRELTDPVSIKRGIGPDCAELNSAEYGLKF